MLRGDAISRLLATMAIASAPESLTGAALESRLAALEPDQPEAYLRLAEELAYEASSRESTQLARRLALLAMSLADPDRSPVPASAALLLADLSPDAERRGWLRALADSLGASAGLLRWNVGPRESFEARLAAAEVLGLARAEENREAMDRFEQPAVHAALETVAVALPGGLDALAHRLEHAPSCPECKNERVVRSSRDPTEYVLCYTCRGLPRPYISDQALVAHLRAERYLLGEEHDWAVAIAARGLEPLRDLTLAEAAAFYGVDLSETIYRSGRWRAPGEAPTSP
jgi:hypothetical protein